MVTAYILRKERTTKIITTVNSGLFSEMFFFPSVSLLIRCCDTSVVLTSMKPPDFKFLIVKEIILRTFNSKVRKTNASCVSSSLFTTPINLTSVGRQVEKEEGILIT